MANADVVQLYGSQEDYSLVEGFSIGEFTGTGIFLENSEISGMDELIGVVADTTGLNLGSNDFAFAAKLKRHLKFKQKDTYCSKVCLAQEIKFLFFELTELNQPLI